MLITQQQMNNLRSALVAQRNPPRPSREADRDTSLAAKSLFGRPFLFSSDDYPYGVTTADVIGRLERAIADSEIAAPAAEADRSIAQ